MQPVLGFKCNQLLSKLYGLILFLKITMVKIFFFEAERPKNASTQLNWSILGLHILLSTYCCR